MFFFVLLALAQDSAAPVAVDDRLTVELVAREPELVTPTGLAVDARGRVWVIESHTHMRPKDYAGPPTDRIRVFADFGPDGRARSVTPFAEGFRLGMGLALDDAGDVILVTRNEILRLRDTDGDGKADDRRTLVRLESKGTFDHNGLFGPALEPAGDLYFALGGNTTGEFPLGAPYKLVGSDGSTLTDDEGGRIFKVRRDGSRVSAVAKGFWNPFHLTFDAFGRLFAVDNDPDERPPCRLLHIIPGGDYGFRRRNGGRGLHPFTSWDGELPGTLPMVSGTGEAPSGIAAYEGRGLPVDYRGSLLVASWGDHEIQRFRLAPRGASFASRPEPVVRGGESFRPVGIVPAPDGSVFVTDWVGSFPVHGKGALWRIRSKASLGSPEGVAPSKDPRSRLQAFWVQRDHPKQVEAALLDPAEEVRAEAVRVLSADDPRRLSLATSDPSKYVRLQALVGLRVEPRQRSILLPFLTEPDPYLNSAAMSVLARSGTFSSLIPHLASEDPGIRLGVLIALRRTEDRNGVDDAIRACLRDPDPRIRRAAIQWVGEEQLTRFLGDLSDAASKPTPSLDLFRAFLAGRDFVNAKDRGEVDGHVSESTAIPLVEDSRQPPLFRAFALRHIPPGHPALTLSLLEEMLAGQDDLLRLEAARALASTPGEAAQEALRTLAGNRGAASRLRAEALAGLSTSAARSRPTRRILLSVLEGETEDLRGEAVQALGGVAEEPEVKRALLDLAARSSEDPDLDEKLALTLRVGGRPRPEGVEGWKAVARIPGDPAAGERVFFHPRGPQCFVCHRVSGRGGTLGPDLTYVGRAGNPEKVAESILEPSKEVAPQFQGWEIVTREGDSLTGRLLKNGPDQLRGIGGMGARFRVLMEDVRERRPLRASLMPEGLHLVLTRKEFRDLVAFLCESR